MAETGTTLPNEAAMREEIARLWAEVVRLRAGEAEDRTEAGVELTPAQLLRELNEASAKRRLQIMATAIRNGREASDCFMRHRDLEAHFERVSEELREARTEAWRLQKRHEAVPAGDVEGAK